MPAMPGPLPSTAQRAVVIATLGTTQILAWGSTYYVPAVFADRISADLNIPQEWFFGCFSASLLLSGLLGPAAGRAIDQFGGRDILAATNVAFAVGLVVLSQTTGLAGLVVAWGILGIAMGYGLYEASFATATRLYGDEARSAISLITMFGGFASTVGWPLSALMINHFGWRGACLGWAACHLLVGLPMNRLLIPKAPPPEPQAQIETNSDGRVPWTMILLASVFGATWFVSAGMAAHLPRLLQGFGASAPAAIAAASLVGPAQVAARMFEFSILRRLSAMLSARLATALHPIGAVLLAILGAKAAVPFVLLHGAGNGMLTIARGTLPLALFGAAGYGGRVGLLSAPARILQGAAPIAFSFAMDRGGPSAAIVLSSALMSASFLTLLLIRPAQAPR